MSKLYIASKESIDSLTTDMSTVKTTVTTNKSNIETIKNQVGTDTTTMQSKLATIRTNLGAPDESASITGSANAKLRYIQNNIGTYGETGNQTSGSLHSKLRWTNTQIGATSDSGGSSSAGTVMGKLNNIQNTLGTTSSATTSSTLYGQLQATRNDITSSSKQVPKVLTGATTNSYGIFTSGNNDAIQKSFLGAINAGVAKILVVFGNVAGPISINVQIENNSTSSSNMTFLVSSICGNYFVSRRILNLPAGTLSNKSFLMPVLPHTFLAVYSTLFNVSIIPNVRSLYIYIRGLTEYVNLATYNIDYTITDTSVI